jgi:hypothetical protein
MKRKCRILGRRAIALVVMAIASSIFRYSAVVADDAADLAAKTRHRVYTGMRSGVIRTTSGWNAKDFAASLMNPNSVEVTLIWKLTSDDPKYVFRDGGVGTCYRIRLEPACARAMR